jgi:hypothetical protein
MAKILPLLRREFSVEHSKNGRFLLRNSKVPRRSSYKAGLLPSWLCGLIPTMLLFAVALVVSNVDGRT